LLIVLQDKNYFFLDIIKTTKINLIRYYISKIGAYFLLCIIALIIYILINLIGKIEFVPMEISYNFKDILVVFLRLFFIYATSGILVYISIAVFFSLLANNSIAGIIMSISYSLLFYVYRGQLNASDNFIGQYIYFSPNKLDNYMYIFGSPDHAQYIIQRQTSFNEALIAYCIQITISLALLSAGYLLLKKRSEQ